MTTIQLTIGTETRNVEATVSERGLYTCVVVQGLTLTTSQGNQKHIGLAVFIQNEAGQYNISQAIDIRYSGMRGNGKATKSTFRKIAF